MVKKRGVDRKSGVKTGSNDFSNKTVLVMLVLVIVVSVGSLAFYMASLGGVGTTLQGKSYSNNAQGQMYLEIATAPVQPIINDKTSGEMSLQILEEE